MSRRDARRGFTLIELSIVLVIIGLIVGGVLVGQDLIKAATTRKIITELDRLNTSVRTFQVKYDCLPGDCANATQFFGATAANCTSYSNQTFSGTGTCNGNGDGKITAAYYNADLASGFWGEALWFWIDLSSANINPFGTLPQQGNPMPTAPTDWWGTANPAYPLVPGKNVPQSSTDLGFYGVGWIDLNSSRLEANYGVLFPAGNIVFFGGGPIASGSLPVAGNTLPVFQQAAIDTKIDDGLPISGRFLEASANCEPFDGMTFTNSYSLNVSPLPMCSFVYVPGW